MMTTKAKRTASTASMRLADLKLATKHIGDTPAARLTWVVRFVREDPAQWHPAVAVRTAHGDCLLALARGGFPENLMGGIALPAALTPGEVDALHGELCALLHDFFNKNPTGIYKVELPIEGKSESLWRLTAAGHTPAQFATSASHASPRTAVLQAVKTLILQAGARIIRCPACETPFLKLRKQLFCTAQCAQRARNKRREDQRPRKTDRKNRRQR